MKPNIPVVGAPAVNVELPYRPPYDWPAMLRFLADRAIDGVESVEGLSYQRTVRVVDSGDEYLGWIHIEPLPDQHALKLLLSPSLAGVAPQVIERVRHFMDTQRDPHAVSAVLGDLAAASPGLRLPGAMDGFELAVRAVLGQQITVRAARTLAGRFATAFGQQLEAPRVNVVFPKAGDVARRRMAAIAKLGVVAARSQAIIDIAKAIGDGLLDLRPGAPVEPTLTALRAIRGVGEWTAQYIAMRALGWQDAFPHSDLALCRALGGCSPKEALGMSERWRPLRAYAVMHLWHSQRK
ncbi:MAG: AlkA N-terminal domain-containing protein [Burkholderiales bacterium]